MCIRCDEGLSPSPETKTFSFRPSWMSLPTPSMIAGSGGKPFSISSVILCMTMNRIAFFSLARASKPRVAHSRIRVLARAADLGEVHGPRQLGGDPVLRSTQLALVVVRVERPAVQCFLGHRRLPQ